MEEISKSIKKQYLQYLFPALAMSIAAFLAPLADGIIVGNFLGGDALAAVNLTMPVVFAFNFISCFFHFGGSTVAAIYKGKKDDSAANRIYTLSFVYGIGIQILVMLIGLICHRPICMFLTQGGNLYQLVDAYLLPNWFSMPIIAIVNGMIGYIQLDGQSKLASAVPILTNAADIAVDYILIRFFNMGIAGSAWGNILGYLVGFFSILIYFFSSKRSFHFVRLKKEDHRELKGILSTGLPTSLTQAGSFLRTIVVNSVILSSLGNNGIQIMTMCINAATFSNMFIIGAANALLPGAGILYGEKDRKGLRSIFYFAIRLIMALSILVVLLLEIFPAEFSAVYGITSPFVLAEMIPAIRIFILSIPIAGIIFTLKTFYQATGKATVSSVVTVIEGIAVILPLLLPFVRSNSTLIWASFVAAEILSVIIIVIYVRVISRKNRSKGLLLIESLPDDEERR